MKHSPGQYAKADSGEARHLPSMGLITRQQQPKNLETAADQLASFLTPTELFYIRSHFPAPMLDVSAYQLRVDGAVKKPFSLNYDDLRAMPPRRGSRFWSAQAMVVSSWSRRLKERSGS